jgi:hypothetical protein
MRIIVVFVVSFSCFYCFAEDRLRVSMVSDPDRDIKNLIESVADHCEKRDMEAFLDCFTRSKKSSMKKETRKMFSEHKIRMTLISSETLLAEKEQASVRLEYIWHLDMYPPKIITSNAVVKMEDGGWKIHSEKILYSRVKYEPSLDIGMGGLRENPPDDGLPADIGRHNKGACANGQCGVRIAPQRLPVNPVPGDGLPADIGRHDNGACANGQCGVAKPKPAEMPFFDPNLPADIQQRPPCKDGKCPK